MTHHDQVLDTQVQHRELDGGTDAVELAAGLVGRNQVRNVARNEQLAWHGAEDRLRVDAAVGAGDDHGVGRLPVGREFLVLLDIGKEVALFEAAEAVGEIFRKAAHCMPHPILSLAGPLGRWLRGGELEFCRTRQRVLFPIGHYPHPEPIDERASSLQL